MNICSLCNKPIENENPSVLAIGVYGNPRYLCDCCAEDLDLVSESDDYGTITEAIDRIGKSLTSHNPDELTVSTVNSILEKAATRASSIKDGTYDFSLDEAEDVAESGFDEVPEELLETEEDKELDAIEQKKYEKLEKIFNVVAIVLFSAAVIFALYRFFDAYFF